MPILIVDDSKDMRLLLSKRLNAAGYTELLTAESAGEAFEMLGIDGPPVDAPVVNLILMDINLPGTDGIEACRRIKATPRFRDIPVIMVTAHVDACYSDAAFEAGAVDYIPKSINNVELQERVRSALALNRSSDGQLTT